MFLGTSIKTKITILIDRDRQIITWINKSLGRRSIEALVVCMYLFFFFYAALAHTFIDAPGQIIEELFCFKMCLKYWLTVLDQSHDKTVALEWGRCHCATVSWRDWAPGLSSGCLVASKSWYGCRSYSSQSTWAVLQWISCGTLDISFTLWLLLVWHCAGALSVCWVCKLHPEGFFQTL